MTILTLREAAKATGVSRQTIYRYAKSGKLSTVTREDGTQGADTSELLRVFGPLRDPETVNRDTPKATGDSDRDRAVQGELEATRQALRIAQEALTAATERERRLLELLDRQTRLLEHKPPDIDPEKVQKAGRKKLRRWLRQMLGEGE